MSFQCLYNSWTSQLAPGDEPTTSLAAFPPRFQCIYGTQ